MSEVVGAQNLQKIVHPDLFRQQSRPGKHNGTLSRSDFGRYAGGAKETESPLRSRKPRPVRWLKSKIVARIFVTATVASSSAELVLKSDYSVIVETRSADEKVESIAKPLTIPKNRSATIAFRYGG